jgi:hypothetical protein
VAAYRWHDDLCQAARRFVICTASGAAARSTVEALTFCAVTRTLLLLQTSQRSGLTEAKTLLGHNAIGRDSRPALHNARAG